MRRSLAVLLGVACLVTTGCGSSKKPPVVEQDIASTSYACQVTALAQRAKVSQAVAVRVSGLQGQPQLTDHCDVGLDASVEFHVPGTLAAAAPQVVSDLGCTGRRVARSALGRGFSYRCHLGGAWVRLTLNNYLPADDPRGPSVLGEAHLVQPPGKSAQQAQ